MQQNCKIVKSKKIYVKETNLVIDIGTLDLQNDEVFEIIVCQNIPDEANQTDLFNKLNLSDGIDVWANKIMELKDKKISADRCEYSQMLKKAGYDAKDSAKRLEDIYLRG